MTSASRPKRSCAGSASGCASRSRSIGDAVIASDTEGRITFLNPVAAALTGWQPEEALGQPIQSVFRIINEKTRAPAEDIVGRVLREGHVVALANDTALVTERWPGNPHRGQRGADHGRRRQGDRRGARFP